MGHLASARSPSRRRMLGDGRAFVIITAAIFASRKFCLTETVGVESAVADAETDQTARALLAEACDSSVNTTTVLLRCMVARHSFGDITFKTDTMTPTEEAEADAIRHINDISRNAGFEPGTLRGSAIYTQHMQDQFHALQIGDMRLARIFLLKQGVLGKVCDYLLDNVGYRYSLEYWMNGVLLSLPHMYKTDDAADADYVYLPHCATAMFMTATAKYANKDLLVSVPQQSSEPSHDSLQGSSSSTTTMSRQNAPRAKRSRSYGRNNTFQRSDDEALVYEGNLLPRAIRYIEEQYFSNTMQAIWMKDPAFQTCLTRSSCRFLIVSIYGRHVWQRFGAGLGDKAVWITHAGLSDWLSTEGGSDLYVPQDIVERGGRVDEDTSGCHASCEAHCRTWPPGALRTDIVMPWTVAYRWTSRAMRTAPRDILAFYSGTANSCSRNRMVEVFADAFQAEIPEFEDEAAWRRLKMGPASLLRDRLLVFPPKWKLTQQDWSELAFRSRLCIVPDGDSPNTGRLVEVVMHGCVPLIISNRLQPPFHEYIDWGAFSFFLREDAIPRLPYLLRKGFFAGRKGHRRIAEKQRNLAMAAHALDYNRDGLSGMLLMALENRVEGRRVKGGEAVS
eukprot:TRINITY_DN60785_c0_g1_i1.p1 TRINITY_DN60785_c0_g1~~TRINITY_DN60785_c0_g1_i1.p1  ORF type:complete len:619 (+),score=117.59 TRINITY_DN60785_c0_g1_i1:89-1945(+)